MLTNLTTFSSSLKMYPNCYDELSICLSNISWGARAYILGRHHDGHDDCTDNNTKKGGCVTGMFGSYSGAEANQVAYSGGGGDTDTKGDSV